MIDRIFEEIREERQRQDEEWGWHNYPMLDGDTNWYDILTKKLNDVFWPKKKKEQRDKAIELAAVAVAIIECLDRRKGE